MQMQTIWSDRGGAHAAGGQLPGDDLPVLMMASRGGSLAIADAAASAWMVLRGSAGIDCREGRFVLSRGQWIVLERDSRPLLHTAVDGLVVGVALSPRMQAMAAVEGGLFPGLGTMAAGARHAALRLWRRCAQFMRNRTGQHEVERLRIEPLLRLLASQQTGFRELVDRCPGRSLRRRRQVFARMQRAWLYMAGNLDRPVRIPELAGLGSVSVWYFTKTFQTLYGEGPQAASTRLRLVHAARLLRGTRLSVGEAGAACGFENNCSFSRAFRARFGMPPSRYRLHGAGTPHAANRAGMWGQATQAWGP
ncbi:MULTISPECIES: helix-turn-helix transcriptional regulator [unclassified Luteimonas]